MKVESRKLKLVSQAGQSIIETLVAIFVLVMGITAALGLANYSFGASTNITKQIIGTGLAREGLEAVKNMRDTNWLKGSKDTDCYNYQTGTNTASCYKNWQKPGGGGDYDLDPPGNGGSRHYTLDLISTATGSTVANWNLNAITGGSSGPALNQDPNIYTGIPAAEFYIPANSNSGNSDFYRQITITEENSTAPYNQSNIGPRLFIRSDVWWKEKKCPAVTDWNQAKTSCRVRLEMYLTNWRVY